MRHRFFFAFLFSLPSPLLLYSPAPAFDYDLTLENTNIIIYREESDFSDFNRLRLGGRIDSEKLEGLSFLFMVDNRTDYSYEENHLDNELVVHRMILEYGTDNYLLSAGRQRVPFGVGRIWNPIDIFNPIDSTSIETGEREGVDSLRFEYALSELSTFDITLAEDKGAARLKTFFNFVDVALVSVIDNEQDRIIVGWELEGELGDSNIDARSEGGVFYDQTTNEYHTELIFGVEYGFSNSLTLLFEYQYNDEDNFDQLGATLSYQISPLLSFYLLAILDLNDHSSLISPTLTYSLSDEMTLTGGFFVYSGDEGDFFGGGEDLAFVKLFVHF